LKKTFTVKKDLILKVSSKWNPVGDQVKASENMAVIRGLIPIIVVLSSDIVVGSRKRE